MLEVGRVCVKIAGREAGRKCVIVEVVDHNFVIIEGQVKRRKCNISHLEPLAQILKIKKGASHEEVLKELQNLGVKSVETKPKSKKEKPVKQRKTKEEKPKVEKRKTIFKKK